MFGFFGASKKDCLSDHEEELVRLGFSREAVKEKDRTSDQVEAKKKDCNPDHEKVMNALQAVQQLAHTYANFIASHDISPGIVYDSSTLPHEKGLLIEGCKMWIQACPNHEEKVLWKCLLPMLSQFQDNVGPKPIGYDIEMASVLVKAKVSVDDLAAFLSKQSVPPELKAAVQKEDKLLTEWVNKVVG